MTATELTPTEQLQQAAECLRVLAHPHRLRIVEMLLAERFTVGQLADSCKIPSHVASGHLRLMQRCGLLDQQKEGRNVYYVIANPCLGQLWQCIRGHFGTS